MTMKVNDMKITHVEIDKITHRENTRATIRDHELASLMASIKSVGLLQPVGVRKLSSGKYECVWGNRRTQAVRKLGWTAVPAVDATAVDEKTALLQNLSENINRLDPSFAEQGRGFIQLRKFGLSVSEIAAKLGLKESRVKDSMEAFERIPSQFHEQIKVGSTGSRKNGKISLSMATKALSTRAYHRLTKPQFGTLLNYAKQDGVTEQHLDLIAPFIKNGATLDKAIQQSKKVKMVSIRAMVDRSDIEKLERKYQTTVGRLLASRIPGLVKMLQSQTKVLA